MNGSSVEVKEPHGVPGRRALIDPKLTVVNVGFAAG
jgi:hypothetical protein